MLPIIINHQEIEQANNTDAACVTNHLKVPKH
jgi:hypothetical protein